MQLSECLCCCCYRKGTNFQANHNLFITCKSRIIVVVATAKVQIFKQITTMDADHIVSDSCCCYRKGTNFQANHNHGWQMFYHIGLLLLPQRYKFSSKSQHRRPCSFILSSCCCYRKGTNFQANHNYLPSSNKPTQLLLLPQRYKFSSKSQLLIGAALVI